MGDPGREVAATLAAASARTVRQIDSLAAALRSIVEGAELASTDDEHDPEGATIADERAQTSALLQQARDDLRQLDVAAAELSAAGVIVCADCGAPIPLERILAISTARRCVVCASEPGAGSAR